MTSSVADQLAVPVGERVLRAAVAAYLGRYRGESHAHSGFGLKVQLTWCSGRTRSAQPLLALFGVCGALAGAALGVLTAGALVEHFRTRSPWIGSDEN